MEQEQYLLWIEVLSVDMSQYQQGEHNCFAIVCHHFCNSLAKLSNFPNSSGFVPWTSKDLKRKQFQFSENQFNMQQQLIQEFVLDIQYYVLVTNLCSPLSPVVASCAPWVKLEWTEEKKRKRYGVEHHSQSSCKESTIEDNLKHFNYFMTLTWFVQRIVLQ